MQKENYGKDTISGDRSDQRNKLIGMLSDKLIDQKSTPDRK